MILAIFYLHVVPILPIKVGVNLPFRSGEVQHIFEMAALAIFYLQVAPILPISFWGKFGLILISDWKVSSRIAFRFRRSLGSWIWPVREKTVPKQEAHGPRVAHLSDIAMADMQILCNIFPVLSSQLMKRSSFKQFFILKKKTYGMPVNWAWSFEQTLNGTQLGFTIGTILAIFDLRVTLMLPT